MHSPEETTLLFASAVADGASVWYGIHGPLFMMDTRGGLAAAAFNRFLSKNEWFCRQTRRCAEVALVWSRQTSDNFPEDVEESDFTWHRILSGSHEHGHFSDEFNVFIDLLLRNHTQVAIIDESSLTGEDLGQYKMLVLPNVACLDPESAANITNYVRNGGTLFATMTTSFFDAAGSWLNRPSLADALGIGEVMSVHHYGNGCGYLDIEDPELLREGGVAPLTGGFGTALQCT